MAKIKIIYHRGQILCLSNVAAGVAALTSSSVIAIAITIHLNRTAAADNNNVKPGSGNGKKIGTPLEVMGRR